MLLCHIHPLTHIDSISELQSKHLWQLSHIYQIIVESLSKTFFESMSCETSVNVNYKGKLNFFWLLLHHVVVEIFFGFESMYLSNLPEDRRSSCAVRMFTEKYWIIIRKGNIEPNVKNIMELISESMWISFSNVLVVMKREIDLQFLESIYAFASWICQFVLI